MKPPKSRCVGAGRRLTESVPFAMSAAIHFGMALDFARSGKAEKCREHYEAAMLSVGILYRTAEIHDSQVAARELKPRKFGR